MGAASGGAAAWGGCATGGRMVVVWWLGPLGWRAGVAPLRSPCLHGHEGPVRARSGAQKPPMPAQPATHAVSLSATPSQQNWRSTGRRLSCRPNKQPLSKKQKTLTAHAAHARGRRRLGLGRLSNDALGGGQQGGHRRGVQQRGAHHLQTQRGQQGQAGPGKQVRRCVRGRGARAAAPGRAGRAKLVTQTLPAAHHVCSTPARCSSPSSLSSTPKTAP